MLGHSFHIIMSHSALDQLSLPLWTMIWCTTPIFPSQALWIGKCSYQHHRSYAAPSDSSVSNKKWNHRRYTAKPPGCPKHPNWCFPCPFCIPQHFNRTGLVDHLWVWNLFRVTVPGSSPTSSPEFLCTQVRLTWIAWHLKSAFSSSTTHLITMQPLQKSLAQLQTRWSQWATERASFFNFITTMVRSCYLCALHPLLTSMLIKNHNYGWTMRLAS